MNNTQKLLNLATKVAENAYAPYSKFHVGAAILADNGKMYAGCNVENVSFPVGICAEAGAIAAMVAGGGKKIAEILIFADSKQLISPCGACRQRILEFAMPQTIVHLANKEGVKQSINAAELLPYSFSEF